MASRPAVPVDPDAGIPDLIRRLTDDSKRLASDEARLAKLEMKSAIRRTAGGALWLGLAFGAGVVALVAITIFLAALLGRLIGHYWAGTLIVAVLELIGGFVMIRGGIGRITSPSYTFEESRDAVRETVDWAKTARVH